jgi:large subunit ribosomal protein L13
VLQKRFSFFIPIEVGDIDKKWILIDAEGVVLGRLASIIAMRLRGKHKATFTPHMDMGDFVIVINAEKVKLSGSKENDKVYFRHTGYPGGVKETKYSELIQKFPERIVENAVKGMLPHNRLGRKILLNLKVYKGKEHPHLAQQPKPLKI